MRNNQRTERPGREIKIDNSEINNNNITVKIGTTENKNSPETVYLIMTFWVDIKEKEKLKSETQNFDTYISSLYSRELKKIKTVYLKDILNENKYFPFYYDNIYTYDFPENLNYNNKRSFTTIELTLHTINPLLKSENRLPLKNKYNSEIYDELISICKIISNSDLLQGKLDFKIYKSKD